AKASLLVGIYFDWGSTPSGAGCVTTYDAARPFAASNERFARLLQTSELSAMNAKGWQIPDDGVLNDVGMGSSNGDPYGNGLGAKAAEYDHLMLLGPSMADYFSTPSKMPGAVTEPLYITDPFEGSIAASSQGQHVIGAAIAKAVGEYFSSSAH
ncbi:MAG TPA: hypothetical protein VGP46_01270, partial [Acidimicrobiales bacterium]|nr:hypothetical protein [Acidimicrobiales bacterium]